MELNPEESSLIDKASYVQMEPAPKPPKTIIVRIEFIAIGDVDTMNEKYQAEVRITSKWIDDQGEKADYDKAKDWYPKLFIVNALHDVKEEFSYKVEKLTDKREITEIRTSKGYFWERIELNNFPMDIQELSITFASKLKAKEVQLVSDIKKRSTIHTEALNTFRDQQKWELYKMVRVSEKASYEIGSSKSINVSGNVVNDFHNYSLVEKLENKNVRSKVVVTCFCSRRPAYYLVNCYLFNFLITILSLTIFAIPITPNRITGTFTLILTSVSFKWVSNRTLPTVSYLTSLDRYQLICIVFLVCCCGWHSIISQFDPTILVVRRNDRIVFATFAAVFFLIQLVFGTAILLKLKKISDLKKKEKKYKDNFPNDSDEDD